MAELQNKTPEDSEGGLTAADIEYIEEAADFYGITRDEAYARFLSGDMDGVLEQAIAEYELEDELDRLAGIETE